MTSPLGDRAGGQAPRDALQPWTLDEPSLTDADPRCTRLVPSVGTWAGPAEDPARYELLEVCGGGGEGTTFRAQYRAAPTAEPVPVAVKKLRAPVGAPSSWPYDGSWQRLSQQYAVLAGLRQNPHLVDTREVFLGSTSSAPEEVVPFVVMAWVTGRSPVRVIDDGHATLTARLRWVADLASALRSLRSLSTHPGNAVVHGDVKPENCLVDDAGRLVLLDLGAATFAAGTARAGLHTPGYAAPEVLAAPGRPRSFASDAYSLGATAFALMTGHAPPAADVPCFDERITESVCRAAALGRIGTRRRRRLARHVLQLLDPDEVARERHDITRWAEVLREFGHHRARAARLVTATAALSAAALVTSWTLDLPPFDGATVPVRTTTPEEQLAAAFDDATMHVRWDLLPEDQALADPRTEVAYSFPQDAGAWPAQIAGADVLVGTDGYDLHVQDPAVTAVAPAPGTRAVSREVLSADVTVLSGQGATGLWCRGTGAGAGDRYDFLLTHGGAVGIWEPNPDGLAGGKGTGSWYLDGIDLRNGVQMQASCLDEGAGVVLLLAVNGRTVLTYEPETLLGPSTSGVEAYSYTDLPGSENLTARFRSFTQLSIA